MTHDSNEQPASPGDGFALNDVLHHIAHWLPAQGPLKDFIHHNSLHAMQDRPFHEALALAEELYGSRNYLDLSFFQTVYQAGGISEAAIERSLAAHTRDRSYQGILRQRLFAPNLGTDEESAGPRQASVRSQWFSRSKIDLTSRVHPLLFRLLAKFLDQGMAIWRMPHAQLSFWETIGCLARESVLPLGTLRQKFCLSLFDGTPDQAILTCLQRLVSDPAHYESYLLDIVLAHPGWSGMVAMIERDPALLTDRRSISLKEVIAVELLLEWGAIAAVLGENFAPLVPQSPPPIGPEARRVQLNERQVVLKIWQEAWEWTYYSDVLHGLSRNQSHRESGTVVRAEVQAFFCIDDRECSLRRHIEEVDPTVKTWATAGFFGIDFYYQGAHDSRPTKLCPAPMKPRFIVKEASTMARVPLKPRLMKRLHLAPANTLVRGWLMTQVLGLWYSLRLATLVFWPSLRRSTDELLNRIDPQGDLHLLRQGDACTDEGHWIGYSPEEMADRVEAVLKATGCQQDFSPLMVIVAHGASSVNNPYFAAYDCGACSGRPGAPNARAFAAMANQAEVRHILKTRGIVIPAETQFMAAFHDTTRDDLRFFGAADLAPEQQRIALAFQQTLTEALQRNAKERCRRFALAGHSLSLEDAHTHVRQRASAIFEPRPELNHASNAMCIVGRRDLTKGLFLDRRCFLHSYDVEQDRDGKVLLGILGAVVPVCGGINLEYYFSRVDSQVYGAGSKLPQNVVGLIGVAHGVEGDLLTGLPTQMTEVHDPLRLMVVVEQEPEVLLHLVQSHAQLAEWIGNHWVRLACLSPKTGEVLVFEQGEFLTLRFGSEAKLPQSISSLAIITDRNDNIPLHAIRGSFS